ncbi:ATPase domain-containing protein [Azospirillum canadense]|uniref:ATPase domain-containing protein n=1 Tax=Azospirillum canadense TaxID=403962 RepID=UPI0022260B58|nr:ATPase domain-containing protein [Azospirillum canadense]MCW2241194.1 circadian clock protein KaiC [Azospirillum canadense]
MSEPGKTEKILTGIPEFDLVLRGGLPRERLHLLEGTPGTGKTTIALQFLLQGRVDGKRGLYVSLSETEAELRASAASHGWSLDAIGIFELVPLEAQLDRQQSVLYPSEVELGETMRLITDRIEADNPDLVVIDSLSELRLLAQDQLRYRRQILALKQFLQGRRCTTLALDDLTSQTGTMELHSLMHGVISLEQIERTYGAARRRLRISKMRGTEYQSGWHDFAITPGNVLIFPSLIAEEHKVDFEPTTVSSGLTGLDELMGGGLTRGTTTMLVGPSGAGKSSLALQYVMAAVKRGEHAAYFSFDETFETLKLRSTALGIDIEEAVRQGQMGWERANPSRLSPGEFVWQVRRQVEDQKARVVVIDSLNSYLSTMPEEQALTLQMHELLTYLNNQGVVTILILAQQGIIADVQNPVDLSFMSDAVVLLRFFEAGGEVRKAISVVKKRTGIHELAIREFRLFPDGMQVGPKLLDFHGVLTGVPTYGGSPDPLLRNRDQTG